MQEFRDFTIYNTCYHQNMARLNQKKKKTILILIFEPLGGTALKTNIVALRMLLHGLRNTSENHCWQIQSVTVPNNIWLVRAQAYLKWKSVLWSAASTFQINSESRVLQTKKEKDLTGIPTPGRCSLLGILNCLEMAFITLLLLWSHSQCIFFYDAAEHHMLYRTPALTEVFTLVDVSLATPDC